ncbi:hypothetical protein [uncultured Gimesia sp.]|uniref:hypothetical protein n=1 Tax=uncultured Gimesia sp. TaxID=1678688 RepID=UPI00260535B4|nr:hypothetical protein [uncultured Gimesia sp.]
MDGCSFLKEVISLEAFKNSNPVFDVKMIKIHVRQVFWQALDSQASVKQIRKRNKHRFITVMAGLSALIGGFCLSLIRPVALNFFDSLD